MTIDSARNSANVVLETFLVNSTQTTTLFDFGASHAFVTKHYVANKGLSTVPLRRPMSIDFPGKALKVKRICPKPTLILMGWTFQLILWYGFGWLHAFEGVVQSAQGSVFRGGATMMPPGISNFLEEKQVYFKCICIHIY
jgi:hypothetical protein